jgi:hypothetical protein
MMSAFLIIPVLLLAIVAIAAYSLQRRLSGKADDQKMVEPPKIGLFAVDDESKQRARPLRTVKAQTPIDQPSDLLARARTGDLDALTEAHTTGNKAIYNQVLDELVDWSISAPEQMQLLASHIAGNFSLRANRNMAQSFIEMWQSAPSRRLTVDMLHIAALSDDAEIYEEAVEMALLFWRNSAFRMTSEELRTLIESEYWVLTSEARSSSAGFMLKRKLAEARRELGAADRQAIN